MSGIDTSELILLFVVALLVLGPERLPRVASRVGRWVGHARREAHRLRLQLDREIALSEMRKARADEPPPSKVPNSKQAQPGSGGHAGAEPQASEALVDSSSDVLGVSSPKEP